MPETFITKVRFFSPDGTAKGEIEKGKLVAFDGEMASLRCSIKDAPEFNFGDYAVCLLNESIGFTGIVIPVRAFNKSTILFTIQTKILDVKLPMTAWNF